jgi:carotenoid cleavage dioxygenase-like enzyme
MTSDKIIFIEQPYCLSVPKIMTAGLFSRSFRECISWYPNYKTRIYVIPRDAGKAEKLIYETDDLFTFHHINAYEEDGNIILDVAAYDDALFVDTIVTESNKSAAQMFHGASPRRYVLPTKLSENVKPEQNLVTLKNCHAKAVLRAGSDGNIIDVTPHKFSHNWFEFPRINYKYNGEKYNFFYGAEASPARHELTALSEPDILSKYDIKSDKWSKWVGQGVLASEPVFVPNPTLDNPEEDDGVILSGLLHEENPNSVTLLILNAKDMKELAKVKFDTVGPVSSTFHGMWAHDGEKIHTY